MTSYQDCFQLKELWAFYVSAYGVQPKNSSAKRFKFYLKSGLNFSGEREIIVCCLHAKLYGELT